MTYPVKISLNNLKLVSQCPRKAILSSKLAPIDQSIRLSAITSVISKAYLRAMEFESKAEWRRILNWLDTILFKDIDIANEEQYIQAKQEAEACLLFIHSWYKDMYLPEQEIVYTKIPISYSIGSYEIYSEIPIVKLRETPSILLFKNNDSSLWSLSHDIGIKGQQFLLSKLLGVDNISTECLLLGDKGGYNKTQIFSDKKELKRTENILQQLAALWAGKADYPSYSEQCNNCNFKTRCRI